jgi:hypothetical protein
MEPTLNPLKHSYKTKITWKKIKDAILLQKNRPFQTFNKSTRDRSRRLRRKSDSDSRALSRVRRSNNSHATYHGEKFKSVNWKNCAIQPTHSLTASVREKLYIKSDMIPLRTQKEQEAIRDKILIKTPT